MATTQMVRDVMTADPVTMPVTAPLVDVARTMRDSNIGDVIVMDQAGVCGIITDRDVTVRGIAEARDPQKTPVGEICSRQLASLSPTDSVDQAVQLMRDKAIRRVPVLDNGRPVGVVSIGDLAMERDDHSALADISAAPANR